jgi:F0F1-type ATP synthase membrane subunit c/vacuolar-type H+-ATPase subunit K
MSETLLFLKALKCLSLSISVFPLAGCAIATGLIFSNFLAGASENKKKIRKYK